MNAVESKELSIRRNLNQASKITLGNVGILNIWKCHNIIDDWNNNYLFIGSEFEMGVIEQCL